MDDFNKSYQFLHCICLIIYSYIYNVFACERYKSISQRVIAHARPSSGLREEWNKQFYNQIEGNKCRKGQNDYLNVTLGNQFVVHHLHSAVSIVYCTFICKKNSSGYLH